MLITHRCYSDHCNESGVICEKGRGKEMRIVDDDRLGMRSKGKGVKILRSVPSCSLNVAWVNILHGRRSPAMWHTASPTVYL